MKKKNKLFIGIGVIAAFALWTYLVCLIDVNEIGPRQSSVGFSTLNVFVHNLTGVNMTLYSITDWLGLVPFATALVFSILGFVQLVRRKSILKVDRSILALGVFYFIVIAVYIFFEVNVINYRPVLINGYLEASYPSSTTMLVMCVMPTAIMQLQTRIKNKPLRRIVTLSIIVFITFMVLGRIASGVHWITDIIGGALFSAGAVIIYDVARN